MTAPSAEQQLTFLANIQRLLAEGQFVATYKYALLLALADIAGESGDDSGDALTIPTKQIAEKFIQYYWRQVVPYVPRNDPSAGQVLRHSTPHLLPGPLLHEPTQRLQLRQRIEKRSFLS